MIQTGIKNLAALVRSYNNRDVIKQINRLLSIGIEEITIVLNAVQDRKSTETWLFRNQLLNRVHLVEMWEGYHWSTALNIGACSLQLQRLKNPSSFKYVLHCSVEALFEKSHIELMLNEFCDPEVLVVGTTFQAKSRDRVFETGRSYSHPRNTGMIIDYSKFPGGMPMFDPFCDEVGGMEDIDFVFRTLAFGTGKTKMVDALVPLVVEKHYNQEVKEDREQKAMDLIIRRWLGSCTIGTPERDRIEQVIADMQLAAL